MNAALKFPPKVPVTLEAKELIRSMLNKDPTKRIPLLEVMSSPYIIRDEDELEDQVNKLTAAAEEIK